MNFSFPVIILDEVLKFFGRQYSQHNDEPRRILRSTNSVVQSSFQMVFACLGDSLSVPSNSTHFISFVLIYVTSKKTSPPSPSHPTKHPVTASPHISVVQNIWSLDSENRFDQIFQSTILAVTPLSLLVRVSMHVMRWQQRGIDRFERDKKRWKECRGERCWTNLYYSRHQFFQCVWQELSHCFHIWEIHAIGFACSQLKIHMGGGGQGGPENTRAQGCRFVDLWFQLSPEIPTNGRIEDLISGGRLVHVFMIHAPGTC